MYVIRAAEARFLFLSERDPSSPLRSTRAKKRSRARAKCAKSNPRIFQSRIWNFTIAAVGKTLVFFCRHLCCVSGFNPPITKREKGRRVLILCHLHEVSLRSGSSLVTGHVPTHPFPEASPDPYQTLDLTRGRVGTWPATEQGPKSICDEESLLRCVHVQCQVLLITTYLQLQAFVQSVLTGRPRTTKNGQEKNTTTQQFPFECSQNKLCQNRRCG